MARSLPADSRGCCQISRFRQSTASLDTSAMLVSRAVRAARVVYLHHAVGCAICYTANRCLVAPLVLVGLFGRPIMSQQPPSVTESQPDAEPPQQPRPTISRRT